MERDYFQNLYVEQESDARLNKTKILFFVASRFLFAHRLFFILDYLFLHHRLIVKKHCSNARLLKKEFDNFGRWRLVTLKLLFLAKFKFYNLGNCVFRKCFNFAILQKVC